MVLHGNFRAANASRQFQSCQVTQVGELRGGATMSQCVTAMFAQSTKHNWPKFYPDNAQVLPGSGTANASRLYLITISVPLLRIYFDVTLTEHQLLWMWHQYNYEYHLTTLNILAKILHLLLNDVLTVAQVTVISY